MIFRRTKLNTSDQILRQWNKFRVWGKWNVPACLAQVSNIHTLCKKYKLNPEMDFRMDFYGYVLFDEIKLSMQHDCTSK